MPVFKNKKANKQKRVSGFLLTFKHAISGDYYLNSGLLLNQQRCATKELKQKFIAINVPKKDKNTQKVQDFFFKLKRTVFLF